MRLMESSRAGVGTAPGDQPHVTQASRRCPGAGEGTGGTGRPRGWPKRPHNYKASGSCAAEAIQEIGLIGSCHGRKLVPAGSPGGRRAAGGAHAAFPLPSTGQGLLPWPCEHSQAAGAAASLWVGAGMETARRQPGRALLLSPLPAAVARLMEPRHQDGVALQLGPYWDRDKALHALCSHPPALHKPLCRVFTRGCSQPGRDLAEPSLDSAFAPAFHSPKVPSWRMNNKLLARLRPSASRLAVATPACAATVGPAQLQCPCHHITSVIHGQPVLWGAGEEARAAKGLQTHRQTCLHHPGPSTLGGFSQAHGAVQEQQQLCCDDTSTRVCSLKMGPR